jgi:Spy/CpxP family protein refolding chaperone
MLALPVAASAHSLGRGGPHDGRAFMMVLRHANLTADQKTKVHEILAERFKSAEPLRKQLYAVHDQIADKLMGAGALKESDIAPLQAQEEQLRQKLDSHRRATALQIRGMLTPEQLTRTAELHTKFKALRAQMKALAPDDGAQTHLPAM